MQSRALTLAISLLGAAAVSVALVPTSGCLLIYWGCGKWEDPRPLDLGVSVDLHAVAESTGGPYVAVGGKGTIAVWVNKSTAEISTIGTADLRAILIERDKWWVVGDAGTVAVSMDKGKVWKSIKVPTTANLRAIVRSGDSLIAAGDDVVLVSQDDETWIEVPPPKGGWGQLRALYHHDEHGLYVAGLGGVIWSRTDPRGEWIAESSGVQVDLFALGSLHRGIVAFGASGTVVVRESTEWVQLDTDQSVDLIAYHQGRALGADGMMFTVGSDGELSKVDTMPGARALANVGTGVVAVGDAGVAFRMYQNICEGRPFLVDGHAHTASLRGDAPTNTLAAAWAEDGLYEHASIASFARFALELLALGAPPKLLRDVQAAIADELRHADACFELAQRLGGVAVNPGPMPIPANALARVGDPIATAIGLFEEACVNESVAACEAAQRADRSEDPEIRRVLEGIAIDERRHAVAGWAALRWMLDTYGDQVREPLRARLDRLTLSPIDDVRTPVIEQLVGPLAQAMLTR